MDAVEKVIKDFNRRYSYGERDCLFIKLLREKNFEDYQIGYILECVEKVCVDCFDDYHYNCPCRRDD